MQNMNYKKRVSNVQFNNLMIREAECYNGDGKIKYEKFVKVMMEA